MSVAVRVLCQFTAKRGDLDLRFTPAPSAREGIAGHIIVATRRGGRDYQAEMALEGSHDDLHVRGRADGYDSKTRRLDEYKTYRGDLARMPDNHRALHWAQAKMYGAMLCRKQQLRELRLALIYFDVDTEDETVVAEDFRADELQAFFEEHCALYGMWARAELEHRRVRDRALISLSFPYDFYPAQRQLAETVYRAAAMGEHLFDAGYAYTYLYPGLQKVIQAAGRVIRTRHDRGVVYLIDDRFGQHEVRKLLPKWWRLRKAVQASARTIRPSSTTASST